MIRNMRHDGGAAAAGGSRRLRIVDCGLQIDRSVAHYCEERFQPQMAMSQEIRKDICPQITQMDADEELLFLISALIPATCYVVNVICGQFRIWFRLPASCSLRFLWLNSVHLSKPSNFPAMPSWHSKWAAMRQNLPIKAGHSCQTRSKPVKASQTKTTGLTANFAGYSGKAALARAHSMAASRPRDLRAKRRSALALFPPISTLCFSIPKVKAD